MTLDLTFLRTFPLVYINIISRNDLYKVLLSNRLERNGSKNLGSIFVILPVNWLQSLLFRLIKLKWTWCEFSISINANTYLHAVIGLLLSDGNHFLIEWGVDVTWILEERFTHYQSYITGTYSGWVELFRRFNCNECWDNCTDSFDSKVFCGRGKVIQRTS